MEAQKWKSTLKNLFAKISETESCASLIASRIQIINITREGVLGGIAP